MDRRAVCFLGHTLGVASASFRRVIHSCGGTGSGPGSPCGRRHGVPAVLAGLAALTGIEAVISFGRLEKLHADAAHYLSEVALDWDEIDPQADLTAEVGRAEEVLRAENGQRGQLVVESIPARAPAAGAHDLGQALEDT